MLAKREDVRDVLDCDYKAMAQILRFKKKPEVAWKVMLNSPRGKFQITNMADDQVDLQTEDIPGASFVWRHFNQNFS